MSPFFLDLFSSMSPFKPFFLQPFFLQDVYLLDVTFFHDVYPFSAFSFFHDVPFLPFFFPFFFPFACGTWDGMSPFSFLLGRDMVLAQ